MHKRKITKLMALVTTTVLTITTLFGCSQQQVQKPKGDPTKQQEEKPKVDMNRDAKGANGVVATAKPEASQVGVEIMKQGGNAIDAAVATAFALGVAEPNASGIGGGGFMLVRFAKTGEEVFIDFRETAPKAAKPDMYKLNEKGLAANNESIEGGKAVAVPGEVAGLLTALEKYGTMKRDEVLKPAIDLAEKGYKVTENFSGIIKDNFEKLNKSEAGKKIYLKNGLPYEAGDTLVNKDLAKTLKLIAEKGKDAIYKGEVAKAIAAEVQKTGGILTEEDLANYQVKMRTPVKGTYRGYEVISAPPSSSGGTHVIEMLNMLENYDLKAMGHNTTKSLHVWSEVTKQMFEDRGKYMGDTDFLKVPLTGLTSKEYAKELVKKIDLNKSAEKVQYGNPSKYESGSTTHFSIMDKEGNMVAITKTINYFFGSGVVVPGTGIIMNDEMDDFDAAPGRSNSIAPGKRPLSSMTPTLVLKDGKPFMSVGSPGATRIIPTVAQVISNVIDHGMNIQEATNQPRMYDKGTLTLEGGIDSKVVEELKAMGHKIEVKKELDPYFGGVQGVVLESDGQLHGGGDPRRDGKAAAY